MRRAFVLALLALEGCGLVFGGEAPQGWVDPSEQDIAEFEALVDELEANRTREIDDQAEAVRTAGSWLTWLEGGEVASFHARTIPGGGDVGAELTVGDAETEWNYRISETHAMTAHRSGGTVLYQAWALADGTIVDELETELPRAGAWSPYALLRDRAWLIEDQAASHRVSRWQLGSEVPASIDSLEAAGIDVGVLADFGVIGPIGGERLIVLESGRLWLVEVGSWVANEIESESEVASRVSWTEDHLLFTTAQGGMAVVELDDLEQIDVDVEIAASDWQLNPTYSTIHLPSGDGATLIGTKVVYLGSAGPFAYDLDTGAIEPVLLEPRWDPQGAAPRIEYVDPWPLDGDRLIITGLAGESGAVGADGPVYSVLLP